jgi:T4 RnlA family RNA ligase
MQSQEIEDSMAKIDRTVFWKYEREGYITCRLHPHVDLAIWNYTAKAQYERMWNEVTMQARGLITTTDGTIIARPFPKFFNYEEVQETIPVESFKVTEKMDGSLGILYFINGKPSIATRGSFASEQAERANQILHERYSTFDFKPYYTYLFEIIFKSNRIVVDYGDMEDIVLLAVIHTETGTEMDIHHPAWIGAFPFPVVKHYDGIADFTELKKGDQVNREGFVIRFENGLRVKLKLEEYVRLHKILTQCTARTIWELLRSGQSFDAFLERTPDEFFQWVKQTREELEGNYASIEAFCKGMTEQMRALPTRKEQAAIITKHAYPGIVFAMLDNKNYSEAIWKLLYPEATRPFRQDEEA